MRKRRAESPPRLARLLFSVAARSEEKRTVAGDMDEWFAEIARTAGPVRARRWYWGQVIAALPEFLRLSFYWRTVMLKNDLKSAGRDLRRQKMFSSIKIGGLAVGLACVWLILLYVRFETSFDRFHADAARIYRVVLEDHENTFQKSNKFAVTAAPLAPALERECPEVAVVTRLDARSETLLQAGPFPTYEDGIVADDRFFRMFSFPLVRGDAERSLAEPNSLVLTERLARKLFGTGDPLGRTVNMSGTTDAKVTGVCRDIPENSHLRFDFILSFATLSAGGGNEWENWNNYGYYTYVKLRPGASADALTPKIRAVVAAHAGQEEADTRVPFLLPLTGIHFATEFNFGMEATNDRRLVMLFSLIAVFILALACINYMNLTTARFVQRSREVGIRRVVGAERGHLIRQFLVESLFVSGLAVLLSVALVGFVLPAFNRFVGRSLSLRLLDGPGLFVVLTGAVVLVGLLAGSYPAVFLSSFRPGRIWKGPAGPHFAAARIRNALVVFQFAVSIVLLSSTGAVARQLHFVRTKDVGYDREQILTVRIRDEGIRGNLEAIKTELLRSPDVAGVTLGTTPMDTQGGSRMMGFGEDGSRIEFICNRGYVDYDFLKVFGVKLLRGRFFSPEHPSDQGEALILNETAVRAFGWKDPLGREVSINEFKNAKVVGVVKDYHFWSLHQMIEPMALALDSERRAPFLSVKIRPGGVPAVLALVRKTYDSSKTLHPFRYDFLDERFDRLYRNDRKFGAIFALFAGLSVFVACLGMFGLAAFTAEQKAREISIRKVLGAATASIAGLLSRHFLRWVVWANVLAWPVAYLAMRTWVRDFHYRAPIGVGLFVLAGAAAAAFALVAVSVQTAKAARTNPAERLRRE